MTTWFFQNRCFQRAMFLLSALSATWIAGCDGSVGKITGKVILDQQPQKNVEIVFESTGEEREKYFGLSLDDGTYQIDYRSLRGLPIGPYNVTVTRYVMQNGEPLPSGEEGEVLKTSGQTVMRTYTLPVEISGGSQTLDLELDKATVSDGPLP